MRYINRHYLSIYYLSTEIKMLFNIERCCCRQIWSTTWCWCILMTARSSLITCVNGWQRTACTTASSPSSATRTTFLPVAVSVAFLALCNTSITSQKASWKNHWILSPESTVQSINKMLSCRRETARCFMSLNISLSHSRSLKVIRYE